AGLVAGLAGCTNNPTAGRSPAATLQGAIEAVSQARNFTISEHTEQPPGPTVDDHIVVQSPNRLSVDGTTIAIGGTAYRLQPNLTWTTEHSPGIQNKLRKGALLYIGLLGAATQVTRQGNQFTVTGTEAESLLRSSGVTGFKKASGVSFTATVEGGQLRQEVVRVTSPAVSVTITVSAVGTSPQVTVPPSAPK
ncbi:MAG: hypothetical protein ACREOE_15720, partial [Gemmatimonadales bacterium]